LHGNYHANLSKLERLGPAERAPPVTVLETTNVAHLLAARSGGRMFAHDLETDGARHIDGLVEELIGCFESQHTIEADILADGNDLFATSAHLRRDGPLKDASYLRNRIDIAGHRFQITGEGIHVQYIVVDTSTNVCAESIAKVFIAGLVFIFVQYPLVERKFKTPERYVLGTAAATDVFPKTQFEFMIVLRTKQNILRYFGWASTLGRSIFESLRESGKKMPHTIFGDNEVL
jgi:hypothetical protein